MQGHGGVGHLGHIVTGVVHTGMQCIQLELNQ